MIIASNVSKKFGKLKALDNVSATCLKGECIALIGPNGSGKTTLIKSILGMVVPDSGLSLLTEKTFCMTGFTGNISVICRRSEDTRKI